MNVVPNVFRDKGQKPVYSFSVVSFMCTTVSAGFRNVQALGPYLEVALFLNYIYLMLVHFMYPLCYNLLQIIFYSKIRSKKFNYVK